MIQRSVLTSLTGTTAKLIDLLWHYQGLLASGDVDALTADQTDPTTDTE